MVMKGGGWLGITEWDLLDLMEGEVLYPVVTLYGTKV